MLPTSIDQMVDYSQVSLKHWEKAYVEYVREKVIDYLHFVSPQASLQEVCTTLEPSTLTFEAFVENRIEKDGKYIAATLLVSAPQGVYRFDSREAESHGWHIEESPSLR